MCADADVENCVGIHICCRFELHGSYVELNTRDSFWSTWVHVMYYWPDLDAEMLLECAANQQANGKVCNGRICFARFSVVPCRCCNNIRLSLSRFVFVCSWSPRPVLDSNYNFTDNLTTGQHRRNRVLRCSHRPSLSSYR